MKRLVHAIALLIAFQSVLAQRNNLKPTDFRPLTELPWTSGELSISSVMEKIYLEPDPEVRYPILLAFWRRLPLEECGKAFELAIRLEGNQCPDHVVALLLHDWAVRDPETAWAKTKSLFRVCGNVADWLDLGHWRTRVVVGDAQAIQRAPYWLAARVLLSFVDGCPFSDLPAERKTALLDAFRGEWKKRFGRNYEDYFVGVPIWIAATSATDVEAVAKAFEWNPVPFTAPEAPLERVPMIIRQVHWRRWLAAHPLKVSEVLSDIERVAWFYKATYPQDISTSGKAELPLALLLLWKQVSPTTMKDWAMSERNPTHAEAIVHAKAMLMSDVDQTQRSAWLKELLKGEAGPENLRIISEWNMSLAMRSAQLVDSKDVSLSDVVDGSYGPFDIWNTSHSGCQYLIDHGLDEMTPAVRQKLLGGSSWFHCTFMEQWGDIDVGEAARYGHKIIMQEPRVDKNEMMAMYSGKLDGDVDDGLVDRTFCCMRAWAVVRPAEMREWIETEKDPTMRQALLWMLEHPWGKPSER